MTTQAIAERPTPDGIEPVRHEVLAKAAVARALEIDEALAEAHGILGLIRFVFDFDWVGAERELLKAIREELNRFFHRFTEIFPFRNGCQPKQRVCGH